MSAQQWLPLLLLLGMVACATTPEMPVHEYRLADMYPLQQQRSWKFEGRLAIVDERESISAAVIWRHAAGSDDIELIGPLAQGHVLVSIKPEQVVIDDGDQRRVFAGNASEVVVDQLGVDMPVEAMRFWVLGVNDPSQPYLEQRNGFIQDGWSIIFNDLQQQASRWLPKKIVANKNKTKIKLIIDQWDLL